MCYPSHHQALLRAGHYFLSTFHWPILSLVHSVLRYLTHPFFPYCAILLVFFSWAALSYSYIFTVLSYITRIFLPYCVILLVYFYRIALYYLYFNYWKMLNAHFSKDHVRLGPNIAPFRNDLRAIFKLSHFDFLSY